MVFVQGTESIPPCLSCKRSSNVAAISHRRSNFRLEVALILTNYPRTWIKISSSSEYPWSRVRTSWCIIRLELMWQFQTSSFWAISINFTREGTLFSTNCLHVLRNFRSFTKHPYSMVSSLHDFIWTSAASMKMSRCKSNCSRSDQMAMNKWTSITRIAINSWI